MDFNTTHKLVQSGAVLQLNRDLDRLCQRHGVSVSPHAILSGDKGAINTLIQSGLEQQKKRREEALPGLSQTR